MVLRRPTDKTLVYFSPFTVFPTVSRLGSPVMGNIFQHKTGPRCMLLIQDKYVYRTPSSVAIYVTLFAIDLFVCNNEGSSTFVRFVSFSLLQCLYQCREINDKIVRLLNTVQSYSIFFFDKTVPL